MTNSRRLIISTRNSRKRQELEKILEGLDYEVLTLESFPEAPEVIEDKETFFENAAKKAREISLHTGLLALADDSGLEVEALNGRPGVHSARYAGEECNDEDNIDRLLRELDGLPVEKRRARFVCHIALFEGEKEIGRAFGEVRGFITEDRRGTSGFGYDPVFLVPEYGKTFGELPASVKNRISHRANALREIRKVLELL